MGTITNDYSQPEGDWDRQVLEPAEALLIESCLQLLGHPGHI